MDSVTTPEGTDAPRPARRWRLIVLGAVLGAAVLLAAALLILQHALPRWAPTWTVRHSPFLDAALRAEARLAEARPDRGLDADWERRLDAARPDLLPGLACALGDGVAAVRHVALASLQRLDAAGAIDTAPLLRERRALPALAAAAGGAPEAQARAMAVRLIARADPHGQRAALARAVRDADPSIRVDALHALAALREPAMEEAIAVGVGDDHFRAHAAACEGLVGLPAPAGLDGLRRAARDRRPGWRRVGVEALLRRADIPGAERTALLIATIGELRDDAVPGNATQAMRTLWRHAVDADGRAALRSALETGDRQCRQIAAHLLRGVGEPASPALVAAAIEGLAADELGPRRGSIANGTGAARWLRDRPETDAALIEALRTAADPQQRYMAACLLGIRGRGECAEQIAAVLLPHLGDNRIAGDAALAARALYRLGSAAKPFLQAALPHADAQARPLIERILREDGRPPRDPARADRPRPAPPGTVDPASEAIERDLAVPDEDAWPQPGGR